MGQPLEKRAHHLGIPREKDDRLRARFLLDLEQPGGDPVQGLIPGDGSKGPVTPLAGAQQRRLQPLGTVDPLPVRGAFGAECPLVDGVFLRTLPP